MRSSRSRDKSLKKVELTHKYQDPEICSLKARLRDLEIKNYTLQSQITQTSKRNLSKKEMYDTTHKTFSALELELKALKESSTSQKQIQHQRHNTHQDSLPVQLRGQVIKYKRQEGIEVCMVCYQQLQPQSRCNKLPCSHLLHLECAQQYFVAQKQCPTCAAPIY